MGSAHTQAAGGLAQLAAIIQHIAAQLTYRLLPIQNVIENRNWVEYKNLKQKLAWSHFADFTVFSLYGFMVLVTN